MSNPWSAELWRFGSWLAAAALFGLPFGLSGLFTLGALLAYLAWHLRHLRRLERWLRGGYGAPPPEGGGIWGEIFYLFYRHQQSARQRKRRLAGILSRFQEATAAMPDATVVLGPGWEIEWFNDAAGALLGLHSSKDVGQRIDNLIRHPDFRRLVSRREQQGSLQLPAPTDHGITLSVRIIPYGKEQRLLVARDISQQQRLEQMRRDFVANVSHELRTPLTVIAGFLETMADDEDDTCVRVWGRSLALMQQQTLRMQHIVEDLLLLSRLETDRNRPPREPVAIVGLVAFIRESVEPLSAEKRQSITVTTDPDLRIYGAERELYSALSNLVTNAVRYSPEGGKIEVRWYADESGAHYEVRDNGPGIEAHHIPRLTERFYRVDVARSRENGGTGLGLAIVKHVLNRHQARLRIESQPGRGSLFACDFPPAMVVGPEKSLPISADRSLAPTHPAE